jgi:hypothetical protein
MSVRVWIVATLFVGFACAAEAQSASPLALSCTGAMTNKLNKKVDKLTLSLIIDLQKMEIAGLGRDWKGYILSVDETSISFVGHGSYGPLSAAATGTIDRVTGVLTASAMAFPVRETLQEGLKDEPVISLSYDLACKPTQRLF